MLHSIMHPLHLFGLEYYLQLYMLLCTYYVVNISAFLKSLTGLSVHIKICPKMANFQCFSEFCGVYYIEHVLVRV